MAYVSRQEGRDAGVDRLRRKEEKYFGTTSCWLCCLDTICILMEFDLFNKCSLQMVLRCDARSECSAQSSDQPQPLIRWP